MVRIVVSLRTKNAVGSGWSAPISRRSGSRLFSVATDDFERVGDAELGLAAADQRNDDSFAGGGLHQHVQAGLFLEHLGDGGAGGVIERAGLHGGETHRSGPRPGCARQRDSATPSAGKRTAIATDHDATCCCPPWRRSLHSAGARRDGAVRGCAEIGRAAPRHSRRREIT